MLQQRGQACVPAVDAGLDRAHRQPEPGGDIGVGQSLHVVQQDQCARRGVESRECSFQFDGQFPCGQRIIGSGEVGQDGDVYAAGARSP